MASYQPVTPSSYKTPLAPGNFTFVSAHTIFPYKPSTVSSSLYAYDRSYTQIIYQNGEEIWENVYKVTGNNHDSYISENGVDIGYTLYLQEGQTYEIKYIFSYNEHLFDSQDITITATYRFTVVDNRLPLKKWTMKDVINRVLDVAEPIRLGEKPRFKLNEAQAEKFDKILAPQFSFTKQTLRECLQECGKIIHGEPRLDIKKDSDGKYYYEVSFDLYGQTEKSKIFHKKYVTQTVSQVINTYASHLDSNAENLVNQLDKFQGVIIEPYRSGYKSVRTETIYARITDSNMIISTQYPIYSVEKLECSFLDGDNWRSVTITPWLFESSVYNTQLSSYKSEHPYSKAYGLSYTQGQKNITALNFKEEHYIHEVFNRYAIVNILRAALQDSSISISDYPLLSFRVTYTPFYNVRVGQTKTYYPEYPYSAALIYNQQANVIESRYYGENLKGAIARIGNVEKSITFILARLWEIPKAGQMYDDDYYISAVSVEFLPTYIKCTIGLSKDFNRLSQYIGISSVKRFSEISQTQALERNTLYKEYVVIGDEIEPDSDSLIGEKMISGIADTFTQSSDFLPLTNASASGGTYKIPTYDLGEDVTSFVSTYFLLFYFIKVTGQKEKTIRITYGTDDNKKTADFYIPLDEYQIPIAFVGNPTIYSAYVINNALPGVNLPVISSAFGNSLSFSWRYEDNFSAGPISQYATNGNVSGYFQNNYQYTDYYGRMYYYNFDIQKDGVVVNSKENIEEIATELPEGGYPIESGYFGTKDRPFIIRKDSREILQINVQIDFVTNLSNLIIGSALAAYCPLVRGTDSSLKSKLYVFNEPLNKFINHVQGSINVDLSTLPSTDITVTMGDGKFSVNAGAFPASGKAWAIVTAQTETDAVKVEDEQGEIYEQKEIKGGDVLIAQNIEVSEGQSFTPIYFTKKRKIFDDSVWVDVR